MGKQCRKIKRSSLVITTLVLSVEAPTATADTMVSFAGTFYQENLADTKGSDVGVANATFTTVLSSPYQGTLSASVAGSLSHGVLGTTATVSCANAPATTVVFE